MKLVRLLCPAVLLLLAAVLRAGPGGPFMVLQDFDHLPFEGWDSEASGVGCETGDFDKDGDQELRLTESGRKAVCRFKIKRDSQLAEAVLSGKLTRLRFSAALPPGFVPATPPKIQVAFLTNARTEDGKDTYGKVGGARQVVLSDAQTRHADFDLLAGASATGESFASLLTRFTQGEGTYFMVIVQQVAPDEQVASVVYDDFVIAPADGKH